MFGVREPYAQLPDRRTMRIFIAQADEPTHLVNRARRALCEVMLAAAHTAHDAISTKDVGLVGCAPRTASYGQAIAFADGHMTRVTAARASIGDVDKPVRGVKECRVQGAAGVNRERVVRSDIARRDGRRLRPRSAAWLERVLEVRVVLVVVNDMHGAGRIDDERGLTIHQRRG